jgi:hypothetical protein
VRIDRGAQLLVAVLGLGAGDADLQPELVTKVKAPASGGEKRRN